MTNPTADHGVDGPAYDAATNPDPADFITPGDFLRRNGGTEAVSSMVALVPGLLSAAIAKAPPNEQVYYAQLNAEISRQRSREEAARLIADERRADRPPADVALLTEVQDRPAPPGDRIDQLAPWSASTLITAQRKTGKTTLVGNLARCLLSGEPFLGVHDVTSVAGRVAIMNYEVSAHTLGRWLGDVGVDADRVVLVNLRGRGNPLANADDRADLAAQLRALDVETLIVDPFSRAFTGENQNDAGQVTAFLGMLDAFAREEVGALDLFLTNHAGWAGERTRGSSALEDWPDALWRLVADDHGTRFFSAFGRDVDVPEDALDYDQETRRLTLAGSGSRRATAHAAHTSELIAAVAQLVTATPGMKTAALEEAVVVPRQRGDLAKALEQAVQDGQIVRRIGPRGVRLYYPPEA